MLERGVASTIARTEEESLPRHARASLGCAAGYIFDVDQSLEVTTARRVHSGQTP
jgi:hypothetical protein